MKELKNNRQKGITLIALVVTIVVLIILATVSILAVFGDNGIIARAQTAKDTHEKGKADETNTLDDYASYIGNYLDGKGGSSGGNIDPDTGWDLDKVTIIDGGNGTKVPLPNGFYYVGGNISTGLVISDKQDDTMSASGTSMGNQFVWIPVSSEADLKRTKFDKTTGQPTTGLDTTEYKEPYANGSVQLATSLPSVGAFVVGLPFASKLVLVKSASLATGIHTNWFPIFTPEAVIVSPCLSDITSPVNISPPT